MQEMLDYLNEVPGHKSKEELLNGNRGDRKANLEEMILLAEQKLSFLIDLSIRWDRIPRITCLIAVLDVRLQFRFEVGRLSALGYEQDLVSSHMRIAHSIVKTRAYMRSSYPSEPILAEASARILNKWREQRVRDIDPTFYIAGAAVRKDLVSQGEVGEVAARLLLMNARDRAAVADNGGKQPVIFSKHVPLITFLKELFAKDVVEGILDKEGCDGRPFREVFKNSVVNFTHFGRWGSHTNMDVTASFSCFARQAGIMCRTGFPFIDFAIPVLLDLNKPLSPDNMTVIFVQVKRCLTQSAFNKLAVDPTKFPRGTDGPNYPNNSKDSKSNTYSYFKQPRSFITLTMELGVLPKEGRSVVQVRTRHAGSANDGSGASAARKRHAKSRNSDNDAASKNPRKRRATSPASIRTPSAGSSKGFVDPSTHIDNGEHFLRNETTPLDFNMSYVGCTTRSDIAAAEEEFNAEQHSEHTQFEIFVYGCRRNAYAAIKSEADESELNHILGLDELYANHPDQSDTTLQAVARQLPYLESTPLHAAHQNLGLVQKLEKEGEDFVVKTFKIENPNDPPLKLRR
jgi:hypothetical protein